MSVSRRMETQEEPIPVDQPDELAIASGTGWLGIVDIADVCGALLRRQPWE